VSELSVLAQASVSGLIQVFTWPTFPLMMLGVAIGFLVGILPGISAGATLALMLPFTFVMKPVEAFAFLLGMLSISIMFGDITSILFGVPGEPLAASMVLDGHPMATKGQAGRALGAALMSSLLGALVGAFILAASIPIIRPLVLSVGAAELFGLALLGMVFIAALSTHNMLKGVLMGGFGMMLSTVGSSPQVGVERYTLGIPFLFEGVNLVAVTVGLFGVSELVDLYIHPIGIARARVGPLGGVWHGCKDTFAHWALALRCSLLGTILGVIPGIGSSAQWLSYAHAVQSAKDKGGFGSGDVRGVIGPGAAMNAKEGGNLITTVAFGVPGSTTMAILLGAFLIQGVAPGPSMLTNQLPLTMSFVWIMIVSHVISVGLSFLFLQQMVRITEIRSSLILPGIVLLILFGGYSADNSLFSMGLTILFGFIGILMIRCDWPRPPLVLGLVLGRLLERHLGIAYQVYGFSFALRPAFVGIVLIAALVTFAPLIRRRLARQAPEVPSELAYVPES